MQNPTSVYADPRAWVALFPPRNFLRPCLLLLLDERSDYGYDLRERAARLSGAPWDAGTVYRVLNAMEDEGLASSTWEPSPNGPQRRRYKITVEGEAVLTVWHRDVEEVRDLLFDFLERYERVQEEHLLDSAPEPAPTPREAVTAGRR